MKNKLTDGLATTKAVFKSLEELVEAMSLVIVTAFTGYHALNWTGNKYMGYLLVFATAVIAIRAALVWIDYLKRHQSQDKSYKLKKS